MRIIPAQQRVCLLHGLVPSDWLKPSFVADSPGTIQQGAYPSGQAVVC